MRLKAIILTLLCFVCATSNAQDEQIHVMTYNVLNYPSSSTTDNQYRAGLFSDIIEYMGVDAVVIQELKSSAGADQLLTALNNNTSGINYARAPIFNVYSGLGNMLFYNTAKLSLESQVDVPQVNLDFVGGFNNATPRPATHYRLYVNDPNLATHNDTIFVDLFGIHLKAGTDGLDGNVIADNLRRENGVEDVVDYIATMPADRNIIVGGDFNFYDDDFASDTDGNGYVEPGYGDFINNGLIDVVGAWNRNTTASQNIFTQSTRTSTSDNNMTANTNGGATGGLDDRFDLIFMDANANNNLQNLEYINGSYQVVGSSNNLNGSALDGSFPLKVAIHEMSDHHPVCASFNVYYPVSDPCLTIGCDMDLSLTAMMEGPMDAATGLMHTALNDLGLLPLTQPYNVAPYNYAGSETVASFPATVVDWVLVEVRNGTNNSNLLARQAALLHNNGDITDLDGVSPITFSNLISSQNFYFVVRHRNHLDIMTANFTPFSNVYTFDFTSNINTAYYGSTPNQLKYVGGKAVMLAGEINQDLSIQTTDRDAWRDKPAVLNIYDEADTNMDGVIQTTDYDTWYPNRSTLSPGQLAY